MLMKRLELRYDKDLNGIWVYCESKGEEGWSSTYKSRIFPEAVSLYYDVYSSLSKIKYWKEKLYQHVQKQLVNEYDALITKTRRFNDFVCKEDKLKNVLKRSTKNK